MWNRAIALQLRNEKSINGLMSDLRLGKLRRHLIMFSPGDI
jgi:hypothetical protein